MKTSVTYEIAHPGGVPPVKPSREQALIAELRLLLEAHEGCLNREVKGGAVEGCYLWFDLEELVER